jgi:hypothetical protein
MRCTVEACKNPVRCVGLCERHYTRLRRYGDPIGPTPESRFWGRVRKTRSCWLWTGKLTHLGYARVAWNGRLQMAHRVAYEMLVGSIPKGMTLDHLCRRRHCIKPDHLEPVSLAENLRRGESPFARNARKTHCPQGHAYDEANTYIQPKTGGRVCRACVVVHQRNYQARKRAYNGGRR